MEMQFNETQDIFINLTLKDSLNGTFISNDEKNDEDFPAYIAVLGTIIGSLIILAGIFGNVLIILSVLLVKPLFKASNSFIVSLAVWDLLQNILVKPLYVYTYIEGNWAFGNQVCLYALYTSNIAILESILHVCAIAFHRFLAIIFPRIGSSLKSIVALFLIIYILFPFFLVLCPSINKLRNTVSNDSGVQFNKRIMFCSYVDHSEFRLGGVLKKVVFLTVAAILIYFCYAGIYFKVKQSGLNIRTNDNRSQILSPVRIRREWTLFKTLLVVFGSFVLCFLLISVLYGLDTNRNFSYAVYFIGVVMLWLSSSINWIIYGLFNKQYAAAYSYLLCGTPLPRSGIRMVYTTSISHNSIHGNHTTQT